MFGTSEGRLSTRLGKGHHASLKAGLGASSLKPQKLLNFFSGLETGTAASDMASEGVSTEVSGP